MKDSSGSAEIKWYRVRKSWEDSKSQKGTYKILDNAKKCADENLGYKVFDVDGNVMYEPKAAETVVEVKSGTGSKAGWGKLKSGLHLSCS